MNAVVPVLKNQILIMNALLLLLGQIPMLDTTKQDDALYIELKEQVMITEAYIKAIS